MIVHIVKPVMPYKLGQVFNVSEAVGELLTRSDAKNDYTPLAKKVTKAQGDKIMKENREADKLAAVITKPTPAKFLIDVFPYRRGSIHLLSKSKVRTLVIEQKVLEITHIEVKFTEDVKPYKKGQTKEFKVDEANGYIDNQTAIKIKNSERG